MSHLPPSRISDLIRVSCLVDSDLRSVWAELSDLASHREWMSDVGDLRFVGSRRRGVGTRMVVDTRVGPLHTSDLLEVTAWEPPRSIEVVHQGPVGGRGRFQLDPMAGGTMLTWTEELRFPWWLGGPVGGLLARPVLWMVWRGSLSRLKRRVEALSAP